MNTNIEDRIKKLELEKAQLAARHQSLLAKARKTDKNLQTRRKIVLGALLLKDIETNDNSRRYAIRQLANAKPSDKKIFAYLLDTTSKDAIPKSE